MNEDFSTSLAARKCLTGDQAGCVESVGWIFVRASALGLGMFLAGEREHLLARAIIGSLAVQTFVVGWSATHLDEPHATLPSWDAAKSGDPVKILLTYLARASMVAAALTWGGYSRHAWRNAFAGVAMIEASILYSASKIEKSHV